MDNMIAEGRIKPFIVVMTYGMTNTGGRPGFGPRPPVPAGGSLNNPAAVLLLVIWRLTMAFKQYW